MGLVAARGAGERVEGSLEWRHEVLSCTQPSKVATVAPEGRCAARTSDRASKIKNIRKYSKIRRPFSLHEGEEVEEITYVCKRQIRIRGLQKLVDLSIVAARMGDLRHILGAYTRHSRGPMEPTLPQTNHVEQLR